MRCKEDEGTDKEKKILSRGYLECRREKGFQSLHFRVKVGVEKEGKRQAPFASFRISVLALWTNAVWGCLFLMQPIQSRNTDCTESGIG